MEEERFHSFAALPGNIGGNDKGRQKRQCFDHEKNIIHRQQKKVFGGMDFFKGTVDKTIVRAALAKAAISTCCGTSRARDSRKRTF